MNAYKLRTVATDDEDGLEAVGRVLIWLMAPIAAETMKYGKTVVSDPRAPRVLLDLVKSTDESLAGQLNRFVLCLHVTYLFTVQLIFHFLNHQWGAALKMGLHGS